MTDGANGQYQSVNQLLFDLMKRRLFKSAAITAPFLLLVVYAYFRFFGAYLPSYGKGGVGIVGYNSYVMTAGDVNAVICGSEHWAGRSRLDSETVSCSGTRVTVNLQRKLTHFAA